MTTGNSPTRNDRDSLNEGGIADFQQRDTPKPAELTTPYDGLIANLKESVTGLPYSPLNVALVSRVDQELAALGWERAGYQAHGAVRACGSESCKCYQAGMDNLKTGAVQRGAR